MLHAQTRRQVHHASHGPESFIHLHKRTLSEIALSVSNRSAAPRLLLWWAWFVAPDLSEWDKCDERGGQHERRSPAHEVSNVLDLNRRVCEQRGAQK